MAEREGNGATVVWDAAGLLRALADLRVEGPLPARVVLVPRERLAHALRRELLRGGRDDLLAGTRFIGFATAALEVLAAAGFERRLGEGALRALRLRALFAGDLELSWFQPGLLRTARGWDVAIAATIGELEGAGLTPDDLVGPGVERDLAQLWSALEREAGSSVGSGRLFAEAAACLEKGARWAFEGPVLAPVTGFEPAALARFLGVVPGCVLAIAGARPRRQTHLVRLAALFGPGARRLLESSAPPPLRADASERERLAKYLFEDPAFADPAELARAETGGRGGRDGSVEIEEHGGIDAELGAAVDWVAREVLERSTPLDEVAVLVPRLDPWAELLTARLGQVDWPGDELPIVVAGGLPATSLAGGARVQAVLQALRGYLDQDALAEVLPWLRSGEGARTLSRNAAIDLVTRLGCLGGSASNPEGALRWLDRIENRRRAWAERVEAAELLGEGDDRRVHAARRDAERLERLGGLEAALEALVGVARLVVERAPLASLWPALRELLEGWLRLPGEGASIPARLDAVMAPLAGSQAGRVLLGDEALRVVDDALGATRLPRRRFGEPAVYIGTVEGAVGIPFRAVRVLGLAEGALPASAREDAVLPDADRRRIGASLLLTTEQRVLRQLHALDHVVRAVAERVVLSAPRLGLERSQREPSGVLIEVGAVLPRAGGRGSGDAGAACVPNAAELARAFFEPARREAVAFGRRAPLTERLWHDRVAARGTKPSHWARGSSVDLQRLEGLDRLGSRGASRAGPIDGLIGTVLADGRAPGLSPERPLSASRLRDLLACPHRFLLARLLHFEEPAGFPSRGEIDRLAYGGLFHRVAEQFASEHGDAFGRREATLEHWQVLAGRLAVAELDAFLEEYPLEPGMVREQQRRRLLGDVESFVRLEWSEGRPRRFVAAERDFGYEAPLAVDTAAGPVYLRGYIDRLDVEDGRTLVRDLKTGRCKPRQGRLALPRTDPDLQVGIYGLVARHLAGEWGVPETIAAAYVHPATPATPERAFLDDADDLMAAARRWLAIARGLLAEGQLGHTPDSKDCRYCPFGGVCEPGAHERAKALAEATRGPLKALVELKREEG